MTRESCPTLQTGNNRLINVNVIMYAMGPTHHGLVKKLCRKIMLKDLNYSCIHYNEILLH
jgi:hypothetical protein